MKKDIKQLLQIIPNNHPALRVAHFTDTIDSLVDSIVEYSQEYDIEYQLNMTNDLHFDNIKERYTSPLTKVINFNLNRAKYMIQGKIYDFVFISTPIDSKNIDTFLKKVHPIIKNSGNIIILLDKRSDKNLWIKLLEDNYFVATSVIDDLLADIDIIISKKMHGWK
jgi:hypothetical protein